MRNIWISSEFFYVWLSYLCKSLRIISLVWPTTRLIFLAMGEVLSFGFNLVVSFPSDSRGSKACIVLLPSRIKRLGLWSSLSMENIWFFFEFFFVWLSYLCKTLRIIRLVWPTRLVVLAMGEVLSFGFNLEVSFPSDSRGSKARIVLLPSWITKWGFYHIACIYPSTSCHLA